MASTSYDRVYRSFELALKGKAPSKGTPVGVALFGLGRIGTIHLSNLVKLPSAKIIYCVDEDETKVANFITTYNMNSVEPISAKDQQKIFKDDRIGAIIVCTPTFNHEEMVLKGLNSGKAVFCEKPLAHSYQGIQRCYQLAHKMNKPLFCAFNRRFDPTFADIKKRAENGSVGEIQVVKTCSRDSPRPTIEYIKTSGGIFHDCGSHDIDLICWIMGAFPSKVYASAHSFTEDVRELGDFDTVAITLTFPNGAIGIIDLSRDSSYGYDQRLEVYGSKGMLASGNQRPLSTEYSTEKVTSSVPIWYSFASTYKDAYCDEMEIFLGQVQSGSNQSSIPGSSILAVSKIASACEDSARSQKVIHLSWD